MGNKIILYNGKIGIPEKNMILIASGEVTIIWESQEKSDEKEIHEVMQEEIENFVPNSYPEQAKTGGFKVKSISGDCSPRKFEQKKRVDLSISTVKERIINYAKEKDTGEGFLFRYGRMGQKFLLESVKKERDEIKEKISGDKRKIKVALSELLDEEKLSRGKHPTVRNAFLYFLNNGKAIVKDVFDKKEEKVIDNFGPYTVKEYLDFKKEEKKEELLKN